MITKTLSALAVAAGLLFMSAPVQAGSAPAGITAHDVGIQKVHHRKFKRGGYQRKFKRGGYHRRHFKFGHGWNGWHGYRGCGRLYRKARRSGSRYWWKRYRRCAAHQYYRY